MVLFLTVPMVGLRCVIVVFPDHTNFAGVCFLCLRLAILVRLRLDLNVKNCVLIENINTHKSLSSNDTPRK